MKSLRISIPELHSAVYADIIEEYENINRYIEKLEREIDTITFSVECNCVDESTKARERRSGWVKSELRPWWICPKHGYKKL